MKYLIMMMVTVNVWGSVGQEVLIQGKILNEFDEQRVKIVDADGQKYFLARKLFPKDIMIKQGQAFAIEINEKELKNIKILK